MPVSRRAFIRSAAASAAAWPLIVRAQDTASLEAPLFKHGVASGDPLSDRVILWTRVTPPPTRSAIGPIDVRWRIASDERLEQVVASGTAPAAPQRDFTVKVDAGDLRPGRTYYYAFEAGGQRSPIGRTRTLPDRGIDRVRLASISCANYPAGYFNVYRCLANRDDLDAVIHLGDYIYEFANGVYGDGTAAGRVPLPSGEAVSLQDYRQRYATYRSDIDLQAAHGRHPFIVVWDDHELANDAWRGGAGNHDASKGPWATRQAAGYRAYLEWMPVRETADRGIHLYRAFHLGDLVDLTMLDTRGFRDRQLSASDAAVADPRRTMLGERQESWLFNELRQSKREGARWRVLGQGILFSSVLPPGVTLNPDMWDGYPAARARVVDFIAREQITDMAILTGDLHSSWALDVPLNPAARNDASGSRSIAVELVTPAISSPGLFTSAALRAQAPLLRLAAPHLKYLEGDSRGYVLIDITRERLQADWYHVPTVAERSAAESKAASFVCDKGSMRLAPA